MKPIDIHPRDLETVKAILAKHVPEIEVRAFGSRVKWSARETSDLDLVLMTGKPLDSGRLLDLRDDFTESDLPFKVDLVDWASTKETFRKIIEAEYVVVQGSGAKPSIEDGWTTTTLGEIATFASGGTPSKDIAAYWSGDIPWVSAKDMKQFRLSDTEDHLTEMGMTHGTRLVPVRTVFLLTRGMTLLKDVPISIAGRPMAFNQDVKAVHARETIGQEYLPYLLLGLKSSLLNLVDLAGHGTGRINSDELKALEVHLPPKREQRAIAHILGTFDDKIELNRRTNETLEALARALFKSWFVDFDPVRAKAQGRDTGLPKVIADLFPDSFEDSELGEIPKGWSSKGLDEIATYLNGLALQKYPPESDSWLPVIKIAQLNAGHTVGADRASISIPPKYVVKDGDVLFSWSGSLELVLWCGGSGALNQHLFKVESDQYPKWFYFLWTSHHLPEFRSIAADKATTMGHIQRHHLHAAKVAAPPIADLKEMDRYFDPMFLDLIRKRQVSRLLASIRDALLPKLISGEIRVKDAERLVAEHA